MTLTVASFMCGSPLVLRSVRLACRSAIAPPTEGQYRAALPKAVHDALTQELLQLFSSEVRQQNHRAQFCITLVDDFEQQLQFVLGPTLRANLIDDQQIRTYQVAQ